MAVTINADTTNGLVMTPDTSGEIKLQSAGADIATVDSSGITMASGKLIASTGPTFSAYYTGAGQSITTATFTKLQINTEEFDTNSSYDNVTNYRFTPTVAGYYQVNGHIAFTANVTAPQMSIYKNGSRGKDGNNANSGSWTTVSALIYLNGSTDYIELYAAHVTGTTQSTASTQSRRTYFQAVLVRAE